MNETIRMQAVQTPVIPVVGELIRQNPGTISLGQGVVHYGPPPQSIQHIEHFLADPENHKYRPVHGIPPLLEVIERKLAEENGIITGEGNAVVVTAGGNMAFVAALMAVVDSGDEIILQTPYYFNHEMAVEMVGARPELVPTDSNHQIQPDLIAAAITNRTRAVVTISPNNPTGAVYPEAALAAVNSLCRDRGIHHIHDEAYEYFTYDGARHVSPASFQDAAGHTISLFSLSKSYGFASWRIGYMVIPGRLLTPIKKILDTVQICPPVISQYAALGALQAGPAYCREHLRSIAEVRSTARKALSTLDGVCTIPPADGAFYFLLNVRTPVTSMELVERLIREHRVAVIPGSTFGLHEGCFLRVSYGALRKETVEEGIGRLVRGLKTIASQRS